MVINDVTPIALGEWSGSCDTRSVRRHERGLISPSLDCLSLDHPTGHVALPQRDTLNKSSFYGEPAPLPFVG